MGEMHLEKFGPSHLARYDNGLIELVSGQGVSMRLWKDEPVSDDKPESERDYETVGYCIQGRAELRSGDEVITIGPGDSWIIPKGTPHQYRILEPFTALEAMSPPAESAGCTQQQPIKAAEPLQQTMTVTAFNGTRVAKPKESAKQTGSVQQGTSKNAEPIQQPTKIPAKNPQKANVDQTAAKDVAAHIPRENSDVSSNANTKKRVSSEHVDIENKKAEQKKRK